MGVGGCLRLISFFLRSSLAAPGPAGGRCVLWSGEERWVARASSSLLGRFLVPGPGKQWGSWDSCLPLGSDSKGMTPPSGGWCSCLVSWDARLLAGRQQPFSPLPTWLSSVGRGRACFGTYELPQAQGWPLILPRSAELGPCPTHAPATRPYCPTMAHFAEHWAPQRRRTIPAYRAPTVCRHCSQHLHIRITTTWVLLLPSPPPVLPMRRLRRRIAG